MATEEPEEATADFAPDGSETLWDWLAAARETADAATHSESRSRQFLYRALSLAYDFAAVADHRPDEYAELLADNRIVAQARAPMTPIVKLVFGVGYDKTRLAEYGMALSHGRRLGIGIGGFQAALESHPGGLKGMVYAERAERRPASKVVPATSDAARDRARASARPIVCTPPAPARPPAAPRRRSPNRCRSPARARRRATAVPRSSARRCRAARSSARRRWAADGRRRPPRAGARARSARAAPRASPAARARRARRVRRYRARPSRRAARTRHPWRQYPASAAWPAGRPGAACRGGRAARRPH